MIRFNGITETSFGLTVKNISKTVLPPIENRLIRKTASDGSFEFGSFFGDRLIEITFQDKKSQTRKELYNNMLSIAQWLYPSDKASKQLYIEDGCCECGENELYYMAKLDGETDLEEILNYGSFTALFICPDPFKFGSQNNFAIANGGATTAITNIGTAPSRGIVEVTFSSSQTNYEITQNPSGKTVKFLHSFVNTDFLEIDLYNQSATLNGSNILVDLDLTSRFFDIPSGNSDYTLQGTDAQTTVLKITPLYY